MPKEDIPCEPVDTKDIQYSGLDNELAKIVVASVIGPRHRKDKQPRQDAFGYYLDDNAVAMVLCDGAGSAKRSVVGAVETAEFVSQALLSLKFSLPSCSQEMNDQGWCEHAWREHALDIISGARERLKHCSLMDGEHGSLQSYHTTLVAALAWSEGIVFLHIGDGFAGAVRLPEDGSENDDVWNKPMLASTPQNGEYDNETYFITMDDWQQTLRISFAAPADVVVLMTDGPDVFALNATADGLATPLWHGIHRHLARTPAKAAARDLAATLDSEDARRLSADDKTIAWLALKNRC